MDMKLDPDLAVHLASRMAGLADELADSGRRVRCTAVGPPPAGEARWSLTDAGWSGGGPWCSAVDAVARRDAAAAELAQRAAELALVAADLRRYADSARQQDRSAAQSARRLESRLPSRPSEGLR